jgi:hypothetical protein
MPYLDVNFIGAVNSLSAGGCILFVALSGQSHSKRRLAVALFVKIHQSCLWFTGPQN